MNETWWVDPSQLDTKQLEVVREPPEAEMLIVGPPGSGKTNLLMLRSNYIRPVGPRLLFLTFTRSLAEFLRSGPNVGRADQIQRADIKTFMGWGGELLRQYDRPKIDESGSFDSARLAMIEALEELVVTERLGHLYDYAMIDEVQDFRERELRLVRQLSARVNAAGDARQRIWNHREGLATASELVGTTVKLEKHYRIGERICRFADQILPPTHDEVPLLEGCNYPEELRQSSVTAISSGSHRESYEVCLAEIKEQIRYITDEPIGVLAVAHDALDGFWQALQDDGDLASIAIRQKASEYQAYQENSRIRVMTVASAKGSEFRAVHLLRAEEFYPSRRELAFTAVTRAKTEVTLYHVAPLPSHMVPPSDALPTDIRSIF